MKPQELLLKIICKYNKASQAVSTFKNKKSCTVNNTQNKGSGAVYSWEYSWEYIWEYSWEYRWVISGRMNIRLQEVMKINESNDTKIVSKNRRVLKGKVDNHVIHGQYIRSNCAEDTLLWLLRGDVKAESDSEITAAQEQALQINYRATKISQTDQTVPRYISMPNTGTITVHKET